MSISKENLLLALHNGNRINAFYRKSTRHPEVETLNCYLLESDRGYEETILSHTEFESIKDELTEKDSWKTVVGGTIYGGSYWILKK
ncbi:cytoplasmic protein [Providencia rettgeri]